jgi:hypothetical protein
VTEISCTLLLTISARIRRRNRDSPYQALAEILYLGDAVEPLFALPGFLLGCAF